MGRRPKPKTMQQIRHSYSRIKVYLDCPCAYKITYIDGRPVVETPALLVGSLTHKAIANYNQRCLKKGLRHDFEQWKKCTLDAMKESTLDPEYHAEVFDMVKSFADRHELDLESVVGAEEQIAVTREGKECEWMAKDVWFRGILDYLQVQGETAKITDYKTGHKIDIPEFQMMTYAWLAKKIYPQIQVFEIEVDFVRLELQKGIKVHASDLIDFEARLKAITYKIESDKTFEPKVGAACASCGCWPWCPAMKKNDVPFILPTSHREAEMLIKEYEIASKRKDEMKKILQEYCDNVGDVIAGGKKYYYKVSNSWQINDIQAFMVAGDKAGLDVFDLLSVNTTKLNKMMDKENVRQVVEKQGTKKVTVKFSEKKYKEGDDEGGDE